MSREVCCAETVALGDPSLQRARALRVALGIHEGAGVHVCVSEDTLRASRSEMREDVYSAGLRCKRFDSCVEVVIYSRMRFVADRPL